MIFALIAASVLTTSRTETRLTRYHAQKAELGAVAEAGVNLAILQLLDPAGPAPPTDATPFTIDFAGRQVVVAIQDEAGKVDLNTAPEELLRQLFSTAGLDLDASQAMAERILDWREPGLLKRPNGAKADDYRAVGLPYGPRNAPFESVEEARLVLGMIPALYDRLVPSLTVYSQNPWPNPDFAGLDVLRSLPGIGDDQADAILRERAARAAAGQSSVLRGHAFTITDRVEERGATRAGKRAVIRLTGLAAAPYLVYFWN